MNRILLRAVSIPKKLFNYHNLKYTSICFPKLSTMSTIEDVSLRNLSRKLLPDLSFNNHKGECGRIAVFGGSLEFTGAPYYAGFSGLRCGVDLVYVFCAASAALAIKSYSPELMVMPYLDSENAVHEISLWLDRLHAIVIGPGLGRNEKVFKVLRDVIAVLNSDLHRSIPIVFDADGLFFLTQYPDVIKDYKNNVYLTPNIVEFARLTKAILGSYVNKPDEECLKKLCDEMGNHVTIVLKGQEDIIAQGKLAIKCSTDGSPRRCGGQGDLLSGILTAFAAWIDIKKCDFSTMEISPQLLAGYSSCHIVRQCNRLAFSEKGRGLLVTDMLEKVLPVSRDYFGETNNKKA